MIHTTGNGELLEKVFSSLSQILYGGDEGVQGTFRLLVRLALTFGAFAALCMAFFRQKFEPLIRGFFLPGLAILALLLTPRTGIEIRDHAKEMQKKTSGKRPLVSRHFGKLVERAFYPRRGPVCRITQNALSVDAAIPIGNLSFCS